MNTNASPDIPLAGIDTGGTFTDVVVLEGGRLRHCKVLSTPHDPSAAIQEGLSRLGLSDRAVKVIHGTTVGTNAVLEGKGAAVAYVTSKGFADVLTLGRQNREEVYRLDPEPKAPPVPPDRCLEVSTRLSADGQLEADADPEELSELARRIEMLGVDGVAINLLFSFLDPAAEQRVAAALPDTLFISCSSAVLPEVREYERGMATWLNASVGPVIQRYLERLRERLPQANVSVMQSSGTTVAADQAAQSAVRLLLSGPAGGIAAAQLVGRATSRPRLMTLDMGGTSTDVAQMDGDIPLANVASIAGWPLNVPTVDIHTIGAGGGSIARVDEGGLLVVGPESAGAAPGPACYGQGGDAVTVTDANVVLGRIPADTLLGGYLPLDLEAANAAMDRLARTLGGSRQEAAEGVIRLANEHMARALRVISVERGHDPAEHALLCFGGAGGLHACELADLLDMSEVILPAMAGVLSAQGMLASRPGRDLSRAILRPIQELMAEDIDQGFGALESEARRQLDEEGVASEDVQCHRSLELRYLGQSASVVLDALPPVLAMAAFHEAHESASGHRLGLPVELVNLRLSARASANMTRLETHRPVTGAGTAPRSSYLASMRRTVERVERASLERGTRLEGPVIVTDNHATSWVAPGWSLSLDAFGNLVMGKKKPAD